MIKYLIFKMTTQSLMEDINARIKQEICYETLEELTIKIQFKSQKNKAKGVIRGNKFNNIVKEFIQIISGNRIISIITKIVSYYVLFVMKYNQKPKK
jgi:hypothetical protein